MGSLGQAAESPRCRECELKPKNISFLLIRLGFCGIDDAKLYLSVIKCVSSAYALDRLFSTMPKPMARIALSPSQSRAAATQTVSRFYCIHNFNSVET